MAGFTDELNNVAFEDGLFELIVVHLYKCSKQMAQSCTITGNFLINHEDRITDRLVAQYLNLNVLGLRFTPQSPEMFLPVDDQYKGRCDIKVVSRNWFNDINDYYLVECKRIDGGSELNRKYVTEGVSRFVVPPVKYPSYHRRNIMFGYIVKPLDVPSNMGKIEQLQTEFLSNVQAQKMVLINNNCTEYYRYSCIYVSNDIGKLELAHLLYDFSEVIQSHC